MIPLTEFETGLQPCRSYYAGWTADPVYVYYYDTREGGTLVGVQEYDYGDTFTPLPDIANTDGQTFRNWICKDFNDTPATAIDTLSNFYVYDPYYSHYAFKPSQELLTYHPRDENELGPDDGNNLGGADNVHYLNSVDGNGYWTLEFYAEWQGETAVFDAALVWDDYSNNDGVRPVEVTVGLLSSLNNKTVDTYTFTQADANATGNIWMHTFTDLPITTSDMSVEEITYGIYLQSYVDCDGVKHEILDPAATSGEISVNTPSYADTAVYSTYRYGVNNYMTVETDRVDGVGENNRLYAGKISFNHDLITTGDDIQFTIQWTTLALLGLTVEIRKAAQDNRIPTPL